MNTGRLVCVLLRCCYSSFSIMLVHERRKKKRIETQMGALELSSWPMQTNEHLSFSLSFEENKPGRAIHPTRSLFDDSEPHVTSCHRRCSSVDHREAILSPVHFRPASHWSTALVESLLTVCSIQWFLRSRKVSDRCQDEGEIRVVYQWAPCTGRRSRWSTIDASAVIVFARRQRNVRVYEHRFAHISLVQHWRAFQLFDLQDIVINQLPVTPMNKALLSFNLPVRSWIWDLSFSHWVFSRTRANSTEAEGEDDCSETSV